MVVALVPFHTGPVCKARAAVWPGAQKGSVLLAMASVEVIVPLHPVKKRPGASFMRAYEGVDPGVITLMKSQGAGP